MNRHVTAALATSTCAFLFVAPAHAQAATFDIPAGTLSKSLDQFARQSGRQVVYRVDDVRNAWSSGVRGRMSSEAALRLLLDRTGFTVRSDSSGALAIVRNEGSRPVQTAALEPQSIPAPSTASSTDDADAADIVVTGLRASLGKAAEIKRTSDNVVDSIVSQDINKFPDPTIAAALQRVPGVQVVVGTNNEIVNPIIRGLSDIETTLDGREIFTGVGRGFAFQDLPAEALAGADVYKSNSADLLEGGVAGSINLKLHKAFDFKALTISGSARGTYAKNADRVNPAFGLLVADRWQTGIGEFGALVDVSWASNKFLRTDRFNCDLRSTNFGPSGAPNLYAPTCAGGFAQNGRYKRPQANASLQWRPSPTLEIYADGLYAGYRNTSSSALPAYDFFSGTSFTDAQAGSNCHDYALNGAGFYDPNGTVQSLCNATSLTSVSPFAFTSNQAHQDRTNLYLFAGGARFNAGRVHATTDISYQTSRLHDNTFVIDIGKRVASAYIQPNVGGGTQFGGAGDPIADPSDFRFTNGLYQDLSRSVGKEFAARADIRYDVGGLIDYVALGGRYANRNVLFQEYAGGPGAPGGPYATPVTAAGLGDDFLVTAPGIPSIDGGSGFIVPSTSKLLDPAVEDKLRTLFGILTGDPAFDPSRRFAARERNYAGYAQLHYELAFGGVGIDGLLGGRLTKTSRSISGAGTVGGVVVPVARDTSDTDFLPNASARVKFGGGFQARINYAKTLARPSFSSLNPGLSYIVSTNPNIINSGSAGNPDLKPQQSQTIDASLEFYPTSGGFIAIDFFHKSISNRVINGIGVETIDGINYNISRPRNVGAARLQGVEASAQAFFNFLPGALSGLGAFGNFTYVDSKVTSRADRLYGFPLLGVSKYNFNAGLLYEKYGITSRVVYTYRGDYDNTDRSGVGSTVRPVGTTVFLDGVRSNGRLDFSVSYDISDNLSISADGTNVTRSKYRSYYSSKDLPFEYQDDDSTYSVGIRFKF